MIQSTSAPLGFPTASTASPMDLGEPAKTDLVVTYPSVALDALNACFTATYDYAPDALAALTGYGKFDADDYAALFRAGKSIDDVVEGLKCLLLPRPIAANVKPGLTLATAAGFGEAQQWGLDLVSDYKLWRAGALAWDEIPERALLLSGAPGVGKTTFPKLLAAALDVPFHSTSVAEWNAHRHLSGALEQMSAVFAAATKSPGVLCVDELDGIGSRSSIDSHRNYWLQIINHLLTLTSEVVEVPGVVLVGATNHPERIDPALLRSGRIERHVHIGLPDEAARRAIICHYLGQDLADQNIVELSRLADGCTGADIARLVRAARAKSRRQGRVPAFSDLVEELTGPIRALADDDRQRLSIYQAGQAIVAEALGADAVRKPSFPTVQHLRDELAVLMAGRIAEEIELGQASTLGEADLALATKLASAMENTLGMGCQGLVWSNAVTAPHTGVCRAHLEDAAKRANAILVENLAELLRRTQNMQCATRTPSRPRLLATVH